MRIHYPTDAASSGGQTPTSSILRSYSVYDNIRPEENRFSYFEGIPIEHHPAGVIDTQETARLLPYDSTDYGVVPERTLRDNDQTPGIRQLSPQETTVLQRPHEGT
ncbi:unnamed protein product [Dicrocoelium dendriticum]|nr:unnamed protein product [Dicrocoelium dendriticum]